MAREDCSLFGVLERGDSRNSPHEKRQFEQLFE
jgi:hypothetical protein